MMAGRAVFICDAGRQLGVGHVIRSLGLAQELRSRGWQCILVADLAELDWVAQQVRDSGVEIYPGPADVEPVLALHPDVAVVDAYYLSAAVSAGLRVAGIPVLAIIDGPERGQSADLYVDQNLGAVPAPNRLAGPEYAMLRDSVLRHRAWGPRPERDRPRVLAYFGGTDPFGAAPLLMGLLAEAGTPCEVTVVAANSARASAIDDIDFAAGQCVEVIGPTSKLAEYAAGADLVLSAAGTSLWELLCIGAAVAAVCVVDNQALAYAELVGDGTILGLGTLDEVHESPESAVAQLRRALIDPLLRRRLSAAASATVDGEGRRRVADALIALVDSGSVVDHRISGGPQAQYTSRR